MLYISSILGPLSFFLIVFSNTKICLSISILKPRLVFTNINMYYVSSHIMNERSLFKTDKYLQCGNYIEVRLQYNNLELIRVKNHSLVIIHLVLLDVLLKSFGVTLLVFNFYRYAGRIVCLGDSYMFPGN